MTDPVADDCIFETDEEDPESEKQAEEEKIAKGNYVSIHSSGFRDFLLKPELLRAIEDCGFEHPSEGKLIFFTQYGKKRKSLSCSSS